ncbi:hypothetical protein [Cerasicoccus arenae]|uniref:Uncharacterized protein n=1 Tax=Cerasicoccus arenae TaxID=424488 RepID=A0A8J3DAQ0_9BACT|nr:hypothetical protein [Cerasicoccus arenae]MBK1859564.1 hypothetical protein [Cerasicoccus arenae]GHC03086.1 hypothetical protein GCM10007047_19540 [Cerasicoccus arenae]
MKYAFSIILLAIAFALGWFLNAPNARPQFDEDLDPIQLVDASPEWQAKTKGKSTREVAEAIYHEAMSVSFEEKYQLLGGILKKDSTASKLNARMIVMSMSEDELVRAIGQARAEDADRSTMNLLYGRWVDVNRDAAYAYFLEQPDPDDVSTLGYFIFKNWVLEDQAGAMIAWAQLDTNTQSKRLRTMVYSLAEVDLAQALTLQLTYGKADGNGPKNYAHIIDLWAKQDIESAKEALELVPRGDAYEQALKAYFNVLMDENRDLAMTEARELASNADQKSVLRSIYERWINDDVEGALGALALEKDPQQYMSAWRAADKDPVLVMDWAHANLDGAVQDEFISTAINRMVRKDPQMALSYIDSLPYGEAYTRALSNLSYNWARQDPEAAIAWFEAMPEGEDRNNAMRNVLSEYVNKDPEAAKAYFLSMDGEMQGSAVSNLANRLVQNDPQQALAWINSLPDPDLQSRLIKETYSSWAREDGSTLFAHLGADGFAKLDTNEQRNLMRSWADYSPREAADWLENAPEDQQKMLTDRVSREWLDHDTYEASIWISELPEGESREAAVKNLVNSISSSDPISALDWVVDIKDDGDRNRSAANILRQWKDKAAARDALLASSLSDDEVTKLLADVFNEKSGS